MNPLEKFRKECENISGSYANLLEKSKHADLALPCFSLAKELKKNPVEIAQKLAKQFEKKIKPRYLIKEIKPVGPYVNFYLDENKFSELIIKKILKESKDYGKGLKKKEKIMIEYSGPNTNKPLHIGHLRNDSIGMAISNILEFSGYVVIRVNIINDRGAHICKSMFAYKTWGNGRTPEKENIKSDHFVGDFYVLSDKKLKENPELNEEIQEMLRKWEAGDKSTRALWKKMNKWALDGIKQTYEKFGSRFDDWHFESQFYDKAKPIIKEGKEKGLFDKNEKGDLIAKLEPELPNKTILRSDGTSIYITNDMAVAKYRFEHYKINKCLWVVATEQNLHFKQLFKIFELLGYKWAKNCFHLGYGLVNLPSGRMKTREGNVVDADDLIEESRRLASNEIEKRDEKIGLKDLKEKSLAIALASIKYNMLKTEPIKEITFNPEEEISFDGNTGPYLQYTYARANTLLKKSKKRPKLTEPQSGKAIFSEQLENNLIKKLSEFPEIIEKSAKELKPNILANYSYELATLFNEYYQNVRIIGSENEQAKLALVNSVKIILENSLNLLGIKSLEKM